MSYTRADLEQELISRTGKKMALVGMAVTTDGNNPSLDSPISTALRKMALADIAVLAAAQFDELLDRAELRLLQNIYSNIDFTNIDVGPRREELGQLADQVKDAIMILAQRIQSEYGVGAATLRAGSVTFDTQTKFDDSEIYLSPGEI